VQNSSLLQNTAPSSSFCGVRIPSASRLMSKKARNETSQVHANQMTGSVQQWKVRRVVIPRAPSRSLLLIWTGNGKGMDEDARACSFQAGNTLPPHSRPILAASMEQVGKIFQAQTSADHTGLKQCCCTWVPASACNVSNSRPLVLMRQVLLSVTLCAPVHRSLWRLCT